MRRGVVLLYQRAEQNVEGVQIGTNLVALHFVENLNSVVGQPRPAVCRDTCVEKGIGRWGEWRSRVEEVAVELVVGVFGADLGL